jgi:hypothetical protein
MTRLVVCLILVAFLLSIADVPQAQTFASPILGNKQYFPAWQKSYQPPHTSGKKGLANTLHAGTHPEDVVTVGATWQYFWWNRAPVIDGIESVPMIDTPGAMGIPISGNSQWLMGFNEPEYQTRLPIEYAAELWHTIEISYANKLLASPAPVISENWLDLFRLEYHSQFGNAPRMDAIAVHCYRSTARDCRGWVERFIAKARAWGISQVWVTEFAFTDPNETETFVKWMETEPMITRYAIFVNRPDAGMWRQWALLDESGRLTAIGQRYKALP